MTPRHVTGGEYVSDWFFALASRLLNSTDFLVNGIVYRLAELEVYYHNPDHPDPYVHCDPLQREYGRWYFHRTGTSYRGGSFKGLDLTFGADNFHCGILIRSVVTPDGNLICGPSLTVDHLLARTGSTSVATLDSLIGDRKVWDETSPLHLRDSPTPRTTPVYATSRVGLSLKKAEKNPDMVRFMGRQYRYLTEPLRISNGKLHLVLALHQQGESLETIMRVTGCMKTTVERYIAGFEAGMTAVDLGELMGKDLGPAELCRCLGACAKQCGS
jgi:hypothetical protein